MLYVDEFLELSREGSDWLFWMHGWCRCSDAVGLGSGDPVIEHWSYAVPVDWVRPKTVPGLLAEIAALRAEIAELKRHLNPPVEATTPTECGYACP